MPKLDTGDLIIIAYYCVALSLGVLSRRPRVAFYGSVVLALLACACMFALGIYIELGGLAQTVPFAFVSLFVCKGLRRRRSKADKP